MEKKNTITIRLSNEQYGWLRALSRRSKRSQSEVVRSLIEQGTAQLFCQPFICSFLFRKNNLESIYILIHNRLFIAQS